MSCSTDTIQCHLQKSSSLPAISSCVDTKKYKYKSSLHGPEECDEEEMVENDTLLSPTATAKNMDESVVEKFIRVVEVKEANGGERAASSMSRTEVKTREDIRRKLAFSGIESAGIDLVAAPLEERANEFKRGFQESSDGNLEICFINEVAGNSDNDDEGRSSPLTKGSMEKVNTTTDKVSAGDDNLFNCLKYEWDLFREKGNQLSTLQSHDKWQNLARRREALRKRLVKLQKEVKRNLQDCRHTAQRQIERSKNRRQDDDPLGRLLTLPALDLNATSGRKFDAGFLKSLNVAKLQIIVNHFHNDFERLNEELMRLLLDKDELQIEQDGQLLDIADLSCSFLL